jgi:hypothetical protein
VRSLTWSALGDGGISTWDVLGISTWNHCSCQRQGRPASHILRREWQAHRRHHSLHRIRLAACHLRLAACHWDSQPCMPLGMCKRHPPSQMLAHPRPNRLGGARFSWGWCRGGLGWWCEGPFLVPHSSAHWLARRIQIPGHLPDMTLDGAEPHTPGLGRSAALAGAEHLGHEALLLGECRIAWRCPRETPLPGAARDAPQDISTWRPTGKGRSAEREKKHASRRLAIRGQQDLREWPD